MTKLSTHVLDTALGRPAAGVTIDLHRVSPERQHLKTTVTNADGRTDVPLLVDAPAGIYELTFHAGDYLRGRISLTDPAFLEQIVIRFGVAEGQGNYHVPLLLSPYGYSTYRGS